jgi:hypothetical protein
MLQIKLVEKINHTFYVDNTSYCHVHACLVHPLDPLTSYVIHVLLCIFIIHVPDIFVIFPMVLRYLTE